MKLMSTLPKLSSFVRLDASEAFDRDYYITHSSKRRFTLVRLVILAAIALPCLALGVSLMTVRFEGPLPAILGLAIIVIPFSLAFLYFLFRGLKISHGYAAITNRRILYYEFNNHPAENYQHVKSLHLDDVTGIDFLVERTWFSKSLYMVIYTSKKGLVVGAKSFLGWFNFFGSEKVLEPGPDALEFIQHMTGAIAARQLQLTTGSGKISG
jgi:hypothetical protein